MQMRNRLLTGVTASAMAFGVVAAGAEPAMAHWVSHRGASAADDQGRSDLSRRDRSFLRDAARGAYFEIAGGQLAATEAATPEVRALGTQIAADHTAELARIQALAAAVGVTLPTAMSDRQQDKLERVAAEPGLELDDEYTELMVKDHRKDIAAFRSQVRKGRNDGVQAFAKDTIPELKAHWMAARATNDAVELKEDAMEMESSS
jgi:putative membrane protein